MNNNILTKPNLIILVGPTAVGKTSLSIKLAERFNGEIISADSRLFYRGMDIGTAKPTVAERNNIPHHLIDVSNPDDSWSISRFKTNLWEIVCDITDRGKTPFLVGGTGQYIRAIIRGWRIPKFNLNQDLRNELESIADNIGKSSLHEKLNLLDPDSAKDIDYRNLRRTIRALEVIFSTGKKFSLQRVSEEVPYHILQIGLIRPRDILYSRVDERVDNMVNDGFVEEVRTLLKDGYAPNLPSMSAIGYPQIISYINGEIELETAIELIKSQTHLYVRRQRNWFKPNDTDINWFDLEKYGDAEIHEIIAQFVEGAE
jgi:tRNA dimethylallyltransferase